MSDVSQNMPNNSLMYSTYTPIFGNLSFNLAPSQTGEVNFNFQTTPYLSLEGLIYQQQIQAPIQPTSVMGGQSAGQQNVGGALTVTDASGNVRVQIGSGSF